MMTPSYSVTLSCNQHHHLLVLVSYAPSKIANTHLTKKHLLSRSRPSLDVFRDVLTGEMRRMRCSHRQLVVLLVVLLFFLFVILHSSNTSQHAFEPYIQRAERNGLETDLGVFIRSNLPTLFNAGDRGSMCNTIYTNDSQEEIFSPAYHEENQRKRKSHVSQVCQRLHATNRSDFLSDFYQKKRLHHIFIIPQFKVVYCSVPKVSCTNWKRLFSVLSGYIKTYDTIIDPHRFARRHFRRLSSMTPEEIEEVLATHTKFMFARNPYTRVLSAYMEKIVYQPEARWTVPIFTWLKENHPDVARRNTTQTLTFDQFLTYYGNSTDEKNEHWEDMHKLCFPCQIDYDFIGQYESLKPEADHLLRMIHAPDNVEFPKPHKNPTYSSDNNTLALRYASVSDLQLKHLSETPGFLLDSLFFGYSLPECIQRDWNKGATTWV